MLLSDLPIGAKVKDLDSLYNGKPIVFQVVANNHSGYPVNSVTLITEKIISIKSFDAKEPGNADANRKTNGNNRYLHSNIRKWMNTNGLPWYVAQHGADAPPNTAGIDYNPYDNEIGFLSAFSIDFQSRILPTTLTTARNTVTDGGGSEIITDKVFLPSATEVGMANENGIAEGYKYYLFSSNATRIAYPTVEAVSKSLYTTTGLNASQPWTWLLRTPNATNTYFIRLVYLNGAPFSNSASTGTFGIRPALNLASDVLVSDTPDVDGAYIIQFWTPPNLSPNINGVYRKYSDGWVNINGTYRNIDSVHTNINGIWRKS